VSDRGSATIVALAISSLLVLVAAGLVGVGRLVSAHVQATAAADAAALAAAPVTFLGRDPPAEAADYARANGARLVTCSCPLNRTFDLRVVTVEVVRDVDLGPLGTHNVRARAAAEFAPLDLLGG